MSTTCNTFPISARSCSISWGVQKWRSMPSCGPTWARKEFNCFLLHSEHCRDGIWLCRCGNRWRRVTRTWACARWAPTLAVCGGSSVRRINSDTTLSTHLTRYCLGISVVLYSVCNYACCSRPIFTTAKCCYVQNRIKCSLWDICF